MIHLRTFTERIVPIVWLCVVLMGCEAMEPAEWMTSMDADSTAIRAGLATLKQGQSETLIADTIRKSQDCYAGFIKVRHDLRFDSLDLSEEEVRTITRTQTGLMIAMLQHEMLCFELVFKARKGRDDHELATKYEIELKQRLKLLEQIDFEWGEMMQQEVRYSLFVYGAMLRSLEHLPGSLAPSKTLP